MSAAFQTEIGRDVIEATGKDAVTFLQGQLSQDVAAMTPGHSGYSLLLQPQGKIDAWLRVTRIHSDTYVLDVAAGWGEAVLARLNRFKLRTACELTPLEGWTCWAVRGIDRHEAGCPDRGVDHIVADAGWPNVAGFDRLGPGIGLLGGIPTADTGRYVTARVLAGVPEMGTELDDGTIPAEAGAWLIERSVSFTKGCYTGQELVARVDSRGSNTPRKLRLLRAAGGLSLDAQVMMAGGEVGRITTASADGTCALAYVKRAVVPPATVQVAGHPATVEALPGE